jgi:hypothetical protein
MSETVLDISEIQNFFAAETPRQEKGAADTAAPNQSTAYQAEMEPEKTAQPESEKPNEPVKNTVTDEEARMSGAVWAMGIDVVFDVAGKPLLYRKFGKKFTEDQKAKAESLLWLTDAQLKEVSDEDRLLLDRYKSVMQRLSEKEKQLALTKSEKDEMIDNLAYYYKNTGKKISPEVVIVIEVLHKVGKRIVTVLTD